VDRIVPAMSVEQKSRQAHMLGVFDEGAVSTEPFSQWIIEDKFATERPDWASAGVQFVDDIRPFEEIKLRLLNASHSAIAYTGLLAGLETVDKVMSDPVTSGFIERLMEEELVPALEVPQGFDIARYREQLLVRFRNPCLGHRCIQIAMDGTEKIPQRWLQTLQQRSCPLLVKALAIWCYFVLRTDLEIDDPRREQLLALRQNSGALSERLDEILSLAGLAPQTLSDFGKLAPMVLDKLQLIEKRGIRALLYP
jgi:fructuronate reductase